MRKKKLFSKATEYVLNRSPSELLTLKVRDIADFLNVSAPHLSRAFKDEMEISLKKFLTNEKMFTIRFLLIQNKNVSIKDLSRNFDFSSSEIS